MANPVTFWIVQIGIWIVVVGSWLNMECETEGGARIVAYTVGLVIFGFGTLANYAVNGEGKGS